MHIKKQVHLFACFEGPQFSRRTRYNKNIQMKNALYCYKNVIVRSIVVKFVTIYLINNIRHLVRFCSSRQKRTTDR